MNHGDTGADRAVADDQLAVALDQRHLPDFDTGDVGNGVQRPGLPGKRNAEVARPGNVGVHAARDDERGKACQDA